MRKPRIPEGVPWFQSPKAVLEDRELSHTAQLLYMHLQCYSGDNNEIYPSVGTLAKRMKRSKRRIQGALLELEISGWFERKIRKGRTTVYVPTHDPSLRPDVAFRNLKRISARRERRRSI